MHTNTDSQNDADTHIDAEELSRARQLWYNFTLFMKWGIIACAIILVLLGLMTL